jgi:hypothetical protein
MFVLLFYYPSAAISAINPSDIFIQTQKSFYRIITPEYAGFSCSFTSVYRCKLVNFETKIGHLLKADYETLIFTFRGRKMMVDTDLASLYDVPTKALKQQVKRNISRFPEDFMFELTRD